MSVSRETSGESVSRETLDRLEVFAALLVRWNARINLVSRRDLPNLWTRHIQDSLQLRKFMPGTASTAIDLGSGGGFPGLVLAIAGAASFTLVESDARKAAFLREAARETMTRVEVVNGRIEDTPIGRADLITARALAPLSKLMEWGFPLLNPGGAMLLLKGESVEAEIIEARRNWTMQVERHISQTSKGGVILRLSEVQRA